MAIALRGPAFRVAAMLLAGSSLTAPSVAATPAALADCQAAALAGYMGRDYRTLQRVRPDKARYVCRGCPMTMDFRHDRLTVIYDQASRRIVDLRCG